MRDKNPTKKKHAKHAKSSAMIVSLTIHGIFILVAVYFVAVTVIKKEDTKFEAKQIHRPKEKLKKLQVPVKIKKTNPKPKLRKRVVVKNTTRKSHEFKMPEITGVKGGMGSISIAGSGIENINFSLPELDFFGAKAKGEKIVFVVHFGPATINAGGGRRGTPFSRMTGLTIRNRVKDLVDGLPEYVLFNVLAYWGNDAWAMEPTMQLATPVNKQKVKDWMEPVNPLEGGQYGHCFSNPPKAVKSAYKKYPTRVDTLPAYATKWAYPYYVPKALEKKYAPDASGGFLHWGRGVAWAILEQKPDTIFVLTTNYYDGWSSSKNVPKSKQVSKAGSTLKMAQSLQEMCRDIYGSDKKKWPTVNVVVLAKAGEDKTEAEKCLDEEFGPTLKAFRSKGSVISDIRKWMNKDERSLYLKYKAEYGN